MSQEAVVKNAADPKQVNAATSKIKIREQLEREGIRDIMGTRQSRRWVWKFLEWCNMYGPTFRIDACQSAYAEGTRLAAIEINRQLKKLGPEAFLLMQKEAMDDEERGI